MERKKVAEDDDEEEEVRAAGMRHATTSAAVSVEGAGGEVLESKRRGRVLRGDIKG
jgi:hypothetical protein